MLRKPSGASPPEFGRNGDHQGAAVDRGQSVDRYPPCDAEHYYGASGLPPEAERFVTPHGRGQEDQSERAYSEQRQAKNLPQVRNAPWRQVWQHQLVIRCAEAYPHQ